MERGNHRRTCGSTGKTNKKTHGLRPWDGEWEEPAWAHARLARVIPFRKKAAGPRTKLGPEGPRPHEWAHRTPNTTEPGQLQRFKPCPRSADNRKGRKKASYGGFAPVKIKRFKPSLLPACREQQGGKEKSKLWGLGPRENKKIRNCPGSEFEMILAHCMDYVCGKGKA